jgi:hypothetical protein
MRIIETIVFDKQEREAFKKLDRWTGHVQDAQLNPDEMKLVSCVFNETGGWTYARLERAIAVIQKIRNVITTKRQEFGNIDPQSVPVEAAGVIARPRQALETILEANTEALKDMDKMLIVLMVAKESVKKPFEFDPYDITFGEEDTEARFGRYDLDPAEIEQAFREIVIRR